jgi:hypothetical protein
MKNSGKFAGIGAVVFTILAWISLGVQLLVGLIVLIIGGEPVPIGGADIPARLIGILNLFAAAIYWFLFMFIASITRLLIDLHRQSVHQ